MLRNTPLYKKAQAAKVVKLPPADQRLPNYVDNLHEIFFEQIFEQITELSDQVRMARAYPQFLPHIIKIWTRRPENLIIGPNTAFLGLLDVDDYVFFMAHMQPHFKELHVHEDGIGVFAEFYTYIGHLCDIGVMHFPNVDACVLTGNPKTVVNDDVRDLTLMVPNLKRLTCGMNISGVFVSGFRKLEELVFKYMYNSLPLESNIIQGICVSMEHLRVLDITDFFDSNVVLHDIKLPNLEVLKLNLRSVECMLRQVLQLPKLHNLAVRFDDSRQLNAHQETIFQEIIMAKAESITRIALNNEVMQLTPGWNESLIVELPKLRALICENWLHDQFFLDLKAIPCEQMEVLSFSGWEVVREYQLMDVVASCPKLDYLHLNAYHSSWMKMEKLLNIRLYEGNSTPLKVFSDTMWASFTNSEFLYWQENKHVQAICDSTVFDYQEDGFEIDFE